jgi:phage shock protein PspC (stress-responsive transcriptional regulator)
VNDETPDIEQRKPDPSGAGGVPPGGPGEQGEAEGPRPRRLRRSREDRMIFGVSGGLGRYFGVDPVMFRIGFGVSIFFGGIGALAYALLALFVPTDGEADFPQRLGRRLHRLGILRALGVLVLVFLGLCALGILASGSAFAVAVGWGVPMAIAIIVIGAVLVLAAFRGGARWLILPAVALALGAGVAAAADLDLRGGIGDREHRPLSASAIPADGYKLGVGRLVVDLRGLDWSKGRVVPLHVDLGTGQADVFVPEKVCVSGSTHVGIGESEVAGERNAGVDVDNSVGKGSLASPRLALDAKVDIGQLRVINSDTASVDRPGYGPDSFHEDTAPQRAAEARACAGA